MPKSTVVYGSTIGLESTYGVAATLAATDYVMPIERPKLSINYLNDGKRAPDARSAAELAYVRQSGRSHESEFKLHLRANTTPYSASVFPRDIHKWLRICDWAATFDVPTSKWTYKPALGQTSATIDSYSSGQKYRSTGVMAKGFKLEAEAGGLVSISFPWMGMGILPVDADLPDVSAYNVSDPAMKFDGQNTGFSILGQTGLVVRKISLDFEGELSARVSGSVAGAHSGFVRGRRQGKGSITIEAPALATFDPYTAAQERTTGAIVLPFGDTGAGLGGKFESDNAQIIKLTEEEDGAIPLLTLDFAFHGGADGNSDGRFIF